MLLNKYRYQNKVRYHFRKKRELLLLWENKDNNFKLHNKKISKYKWQGTISWKNNNINNIIYKSACKHNNNLIKYFWKNISNNQDLLNLSSISSTNSKENLSHIYKKRPFFMKIEDRSNFINNILSCIQNKDSLYYIRNSLYFLLDSNIGNVHAVMDILNFSWLYVSKDSKRIYDDKEQIYYFNLKCFYNGFLHNGKKLRCETQFIKLLNLLKLKLKKSSLHIMYVFINFLKPLVGFKRRRLGGLHIKKKNIRYFFKIFAHNERWKGLLFKRICFNSPYYQKKSNSLSIDDLYKGLLLSLGSKGPIAKCLAMYYTLINRRTPYAERKKKKEKKKKLRIRRFKL